MKIIVGLGNPGKKYEITRHNIGFLFIDHLASINGIKVDKIKFKGLYGQGVINGEKVILLKPQTYMNLSGESVEQAVSFFKCTPKDVIIVYDDVALSFGSLRIRQKGSDGGHNGIKSIILNLNTDEFPRIKVGIGAPPHKEYDLADYVLSNFTRDEQKIMPDIFKKCEQACGYMLKDDIQQAMNKCNITVR